MINLIRTSTLATIPGVMASLLLLSTAATASLTPTESVKASHRPSDAAPLVFQASNDGFDGQGRPGSRSSGGARGDCNDQLIALLPGTDPVADGTHACSLPSEAFAASTLTARPTLWFYVPETAPDLQAELVLMDENQRAIAVETLTLPSAAGIIGVPISHSLGVNQSYQWVFSLLDTQSPSLNRAVEGSIQRTELPPSVAQQLEAASTRRDRVALLAQQGIWHDALTELVAMRQESINNATVTQDWVQFLASVGLEAIADAPLLN